MSDSMPPQNPAEFSVIVERAARAMMHWGHTVDRQITQRLGLEADTEIEAEFRADLDAEQSALAALDDTAVEALWAAELPAAMRDWPAHPDTQALIAWGIRQAARLAERMAATMPAEPADAFEFEFDDNPDTDGAVDGPMDEMATIGFGGTAARGAEMLDSRAAERDRQFEKLMGETLAEFAGWESAAERDVDEVMGLSAPDPIVWKKRPSSKVGLAAASPRVGDRLHVPAVQIFPLALSPVLSVERAYLYRENEALFVLTDDPLREETLPAKLAYLDGSRDELTVELRLAAPQLVVPQLDALLAYRVYRKQYKVMLKWDVPITALSVSTIDGEPVEMALGAAARDRQGGIMDAAQTQQWERLAKKLALPPTSEAERWQMMFYIAYWSKHAGGSASFRDLLRPIAWWWSADSGGETNADPSALHGFE